MVVTLFMPDAASQPAMLLSLRRHTDDVCALCILVTLLSTVTVHGAVVELTAAADTAAALAVCVHVACRAVTK
jgi:hypothetical protein